MTHEPLPGIKVGDIGAKLGLNAVNNGFLGFDHVRIPRNQLLMRHAQVLEVKQTSIDKSKGSYCSKWKARLPTLLDFQDGTYVKSQHSKLNYGAMVFVRVVIVFDMVNYLSKAVTIATRYSAVRRQAPMRQG